MNANKKGILRTVLFYVVFIAVIIFIVSQLFRGTQAEPLQFSDIAAAIRSGEVTELVVGNDNVVTVTMKDGTTKEYEVYSLSLLLNFLGDDIDEQMAAGTLTVEFEPEASYPWWLSMLPSIISIIVIVALFFVFMNAQNNVNRGGRMNGFGRAHVQTPDQNDEKRVTFKDVAGADEEKAELVEVVDFLKDPEKFTRLGARIPHGVLLVGPPGTGKTLLAKAVAGEAGVPFFSISGSDFVELYVGVGASRVRDLFETARKSPAAIIFIDEIDAVGRHRGAGLGGGHDEREQTLNQLLVEMDGFGSHDGIIVMAATNRPDILDPALLRPGRFDRQITVSYPDIKGREAILKVHARNKPLEESVSLPMIAKSTVGFTGADLANLLNEAALLAASRNKNLIGQDEIEDALIKIIAGPKKKSRVIKEAEKRKTAYHEAGHALLAYYLPTQDPVQQISVIPSGKALGYTLNPPVEDKFSVYKNELKEEIAMLLGGRAAEELVFDDVSGGASNDIERATKVAKNMVMKLGMSDELGPINFGSADGEVFLGTQLSHGNDHSEATAARIDAEVQKLVNEAYAKAKEIIAAHRDKLDFVAEYLTTREIMDGTQFAVAMQRDNVTAEDLDNMAEDKRRRSREENAAAPRNPLGKDADKQDEAPAASDAPADSAETDAPAEEPADDAPEAPVENTDAPDETPDDTPADNGEDKPDEGGDSAV